jgi:HSP20 family protein
MTQSNPAGGSFRYATANLTPIASLFERLLGSETSSPSSLTRSNTPIATWQDDQTIYVEFDAPGISSEDLHLSVHNKDLTVSWERKTVKRADGVDNRSYGRFEQQLRLPTIADENKVQATLANGVLQLQVPKTEQAKPRKIEVKTA